MKMHKKHLLAGLALPALLVLLGGCESDPVAPHDDLPQLTSEERANQSAAIAITMAEAAVKVLNPGTPMPGKSLHDYPVTGEGFSGGVWIEYLSAEGVADPGSVVTPEDAGWAHLYTATDAPVVFTTPPPFNGRTEFELDFTAVLEQGQPREGVINGTGTMTSGEYIVDFTATDLEVEEDRDYPLGTVTITAAGGTVDIGFDGDHTATVLVDHVDLYVVDLDTGVVTHIPPE